MQNNGRIWDFIFPLSFLWTHTHTGREIEIYKVDLEAKGNNYLVSLYHSTSINIHFFLPLISLPKIFISPEYSVWLRPKEDTSMTPESTCTKMEGISHTPSQPHWGTGHVCLLHLLWALSTQILSLAIPISG